jgi:hypothetical protein
VIAKIAITFFILFYFVLNYTNCYNLT